MADTCLGSLGPKEVICGDTHCNSYVDTDPAKRICKCVDYLGKPVPGCLPKTDAYPIPTASCYNKVEKRWLNISDEACQERRDSDPNWSWKACFCCCSCVAWGTQVLVGKGMNRSIEQLEFQDPVMAASMAVVGGKPVLTWTQRRIQLSAGTTTANVSNSIRIAYGDTGEVMCTGDQPLVLADGTYVHAGKVQAGMYLLTDQGEPVQVTGTDLGDHTTGLWHIATDVADLKTMDGHLVSFNGLLAGDFVAQQILGVTLQSDHRPLIGSDAYAVHGSRFHSTLPGKEPPPLRTEGFIPYRLIERMPVPVGAVRYVSKLQADDIKKAPSAPPTSAYNKANFDRLVALYRGFHPELHIVCQWEMEEPNLFAFDTYGIKTILVSGALLRVKALGQEGLALILAHGIARFLGAPPVDQKGFACTGQADFFSIGYVVNQAFYGAGFELLEVGIPQIKELFSFICKDHRGGVDKCEHPSISCRLDAIGAARSGSVLPECAGAPIPDALRLESAEVISVDDLSGLILTFNMPVSRRSLERTSNFIISPVSSVQFADLDPQTPEEVLLSVRFAAERDGEFTIQLRDVLAADGSTLDPAHSTATFKVPKPT